MNVRSVGIVIAFAMSLDAARADTLPALASLRHLAFDYTFSVVEVTERRDSDGQYAAGSKGFGSARAHNGSFVLSNRKTGTITVDIVAATSDGGLVADVREGEGGRLSEPVRCTVSESSAVIFDPRFTVSEQAQAALRYLSRGFFSPSVLHAGGTWDLNRKGTGFAENATYRLTSEPRSDLADVSFTMTRSIGGSRIMQSVEHGTMTYHTVLLVPEAFDTEIRILETQGTSNISSDETIALRLTDDSFAKPDGHVQRSPKP